MVPLRYNLNKVLHIMNSTTTTATYELPNGTLKCTYTYTTGRYGVEAKETHAVTLRTNEYADGKVSEEVSAWCNYNARRSIHSVSDTDEVPTTSNVTCSKCLKGVAKMEAK